MKKPQAILSLLDNKESRVVTIFGNIIYDTSFFKDRLKILYGSLEFTLDKQFICCCDILVLLSNNIVTIKTLKQYINEKKIPKKLVYPFMDFLVKCNILSVFTNDYEASDFLKKTSIGHFHQPLVETTRNTDNSAKTNSKDAEKTRFATPKP